MPIRFVSWNIKQFSGSKSDSTLSTGKRPLPSLYRQLAGQRVVARMAQVLTQPPLQADLVGIEEVMPQTGSIALANLRQALNQAGAAWTALVSQVNMAPDPTTKKLSGRADAYGVLVKAPLTVDPPQLAQGGQWIDRRPCAFLARPAGATPIRFVVWHATQKKVTKNQATKRTMIQGLARWLRLPASSGPKRRRTSVERTVVAGDFNVPTTPAAAMFAALEALGLEGVVDGELTSMQQAATVQGAAKQFGDWADPTKLGDLFLSEPYDDIFVSKDLGHSGDAVDNIPVELLAELCARLGCTTATLGAQPVSTRSDAVGGAAKVTWRLSDHLPVVSVIS